MGKKFEVTTEDGYLVECELDDDVTEDELDNHPAPENALTPEQIQEIEDDEEVHD